MDPGVESAASRLGRARRVTVITGAGVSAASGIPTFRGAAGLWRTFRPEDLATPGAFARDPRTVWEWYDWRRQMIAAAVPNSAHETIAAWSRRFEAFTLVTQNVDGLHELAGTLSVIRFHGSIWILRCAASCGAQPDGWEDRTAPLEELPPQSGHRGWRNICSRSWVAEAVFNIAAISASRYELERLYYNSK